MDAGPVSGGRSGCRRRLPGSPTRGSSTLRNQKDRRPCIQATWSVHAPSCRGRRSKSCRTAGRGEASGGGGRPSAPPHRAMAPGTSGPSVRVRPFDPSNPIEGTFLETIHRNGRKHTHRHTHSFKEMPYCFIGKTMGTSCTRVGDGDGGAGATPSRGCAGRGRGLFHLPRGPARPMPRAAPLHLRTHVHDAGAHVPSGQSRPGSGRSCAGARSSPPAGP